MILRRPGGDVCLTWFVADARKAGGACLRTTGAVQKLDTAQRQLLLQDGRSIPLDDILALELL